ncbi:MAG TPA: tyrosine-type recombinase/integrase [Steroidobacteraceae bacterium]|jgi:integrase|nr:tyrosine-type recombinase/integrase [Steroidobacteraceae bacterium]
MGSVYRRGQLYWIKYRLGGRVVRESAGTTDEAEARQLLGLRQGELPRRTRLTTYDELAALVLADYRANGRRSLKDVEGYMRRHLNPFFTGLRVSRIGGTVCDQYLRIRQVEGASNGTINRELSVVRRGFSLGRQRQLVDVVPYIPRLREENTREAYFEPHQFEALRAALPEYLRPVVTFAYITGWRVPSEVLTRQWKHVDFARGAVSLEPGEAKSGAGRIFPFTSALQQCLEDQRARTPDGCPWVFFRQWRDGRWERVQSFKKVWAHACAAAGVPGMIRHDFRRTAARNLLDAGVAERDVMLMVGWSQRTMLDRYTGLRLASLREAAAKLDRWQAAQAAR